MKHCLYISKIRKRNCETFRELTFTNIGFPSYDGVRRRVSGLRREPVVSVNNPTLIPTSHWKRWFRPCRGRLVASSVRVFCALNSQREGKSLPQHGRGHLFQWDVGISVWFSTETTGSLRYPETWHTLSYHSIFTSLNRGYEAAILAFTCWKLIGICS